MVDPKKFWERKILKWETSRYSSLGGWSPFSWSVRNRLAVAEKIIKQRISKDAVLLELGCGSGLLAKKFIGHCRGYIGIDLAENAIAKAKERVLHKEFSFSTADVATCPLPLADLTIFLGLTDWLTEEQFTDLLARVRSERVLFSFTQPGELNPYRLYRLFVDPKKNENEYRARNYRTSQVARMLEENGFSYTLVDPPSFFNPGALVWGEKRT